MKKSLLSTAALIAALAAGWLLLTSFAPGSWVASWAPCPRNWGWVPAWMPRVSPLADVRFRFDEGHGKVCYGRPSLRGRIMLGGAAVPYGQLWRTGANEPTTLHVDLPVHLGPLDLLPGSYSIYSVPDDKQWEIVVNRSTRQWGIESEYSSEVAAQEVGRFTVETEPTESEIETFTIRAVPSATDAYDLVLEWQRARVRIPIVAGFPDS